MVCFTAVMGSILWCCWLGADQFTVNDMQATLSGSRILPPPTTCADILIWRDGARAGGTADAGITLVMKRVVGHFKTTDIIPDFFTTPIGQGSKLQQFVGRIPFPDGEVLP